MEWADEMWAYNTMWDTMIRFVWSATCTTRSIRPCVAVRATATRSILRAASVFFCAPPEAADPVGA